MHPKAGREINIERDGGFLRRHAGFNPMAPAKGLGHAADF
jgi:hypothetical protein